MQNFVHIILKIFLNPWFFLKFFLGPTSRKKQQKIARISAFDGLAPIPELLVSDSMLLPTSTSEARCLSDLSCAELGVITAATFVQFFILLLLLLLLCSKNPYRAKLVVVSGGAIAATITVVPRQNPVCYKKWQNLPQRRRKTNGKSPYVPFTHSHTRIRMQTNL